MFKGDIDPTLQYIKREGMRLLWAGYPDDATADAEIEKLSGFYALNYPDTAATKAAQIDNAIERIKGLYRVTSTPPMNVTPGTYPNHLGHMDFPGCFRCHDGGHFLVEDGVATRQTIPSTCNTCHTFPQIGPAVASLPLGEPPTTHADDLWVFNHKDVTTELDPGGQSCGECHARDYCVNCHATGAVTVEHDVDGHQPRPGHPRPGQHGVRLLPPARVLRALPRGAGAARDVAVLPRDRGRRRGRRGGDDAAGPPDRRRLAADPEILTGPARPLRGAAWPLRRRERRPSRALLGASTAPRVADRLRHPTRG